MAATQPRDTQSNILNYHKSQQQVVIKSEMLTGSLAEGDRWIQKLGWPYTTCCWYVDKVKPDPCSLRAKVAQ